jgi:alkylation response protein AidB-like acyl-CoA dehydrogenase
MDFTFSDDQTLFRNTVRDLLQKECPPTLVRQAWTADPPPTLWSRLADLGLLAATLPESEGGLGLSDLDLVLIHEECGRVALPLPFLETSVAIPLLTLAPAAFQAEWLPKITTGQAIVALSLDAAPFINTAPSPDLVLLAHEGELHALLPADLTLTPHSSVDGSRKLARVDWHPSPRTRIAADAGPAVRTAFDRGALAAAAQLLGLAQQMLDLTVGYTKIRKQFGKPIGSFQAVKHHLADALLALEMARPVVYRAAYSLAHQAPAASQHVSAAKARASEAALLVGRKALQCHGAIAYSYEHDLQLWMKRTWSLAAAWGDAAAHRTRIAEQIL